jgi:hypothetical protein
MAAELQRPVFALTGYDVAAFAAKGLAEPKQA